METNMRITLTLLSILLLTPLMVPAADFYIDPQSGSADGDGSASRPWASLQAVVDRGLIQSREWDALPYKADSSKLVSKNENGPVRPGDTIWLRTGDYGDVTIRKHYNAGPITIAAQQGHTPRLRSLLIQSSAHWAIQDLHVSPEFGEGPRKRNLIEIQSHGWNGPVHDVLVEGCVLRSADDTSQWSVEDWNTRAVSGIDAEGERITLRGNHLKNVNFGISVSASHSLIERNEIVNFAGDGLRGLGNYSTFQYNLVKNCYDVNANHDDGFQSWSNGPDGVGTGEVVGIVLRGNIIINYEDPDQPHRGALQGIGCFDGMFVDWVVENNVICVDHYHGITLLGARGCRIVNNTVIDPNDRRPGPSAIRINKHKNGTASTDCVVRNNLVSALSVEGENMTDDHNRVVERPEELFVNPGKFDFHLRKDASAIDAGTDALAPQIDADSATRPKGEAVDLGAYEYESK